MPAFPGPPALLASLPSLASQAPFFLPLRSLPSIPCLHFLPCHPGFPACGLITLHLYCIRRCHTYSPCLQYFSAQLTLFIAPSACDFALLWNPRPPTSDDWTWVPTCPRKRSTISNPKTITSPVLLQHDKEALISNCQASHGIGWIVSQLTSESSKRVASLYQRHTFKRSVTQMLGVPCKTLRDTK